MSLIEEVWGPVPNHDTKDKADAMCVTVTDSNIKELLKPYKKDYISEIVHNALREHFKPKNEKTQFLFDDSEQTTILVLIIMGMLLFQIAIRT